MDFEISAGQVKIMLKHGEKFTLLDVREPWELAKASLEGSTNIPMGDVPMRATRNSTRRTTSLCFVITECGSLSVTNWLRQQGFEKVQSMRGGIDGCGSDRGSERAVVLKAVVS